MIYCYYTGVYLPYLGIGYLHIGYFMDLNGFVLPLTSHVGVNWGATELKSSSNELAETRWSKWSSSGERLLWLENILVMFGCDAVYSNL